MGSPPSAETAHLVLGLISVNGMMAACAEHGDAETLVVLSDYYALVASAIAPAGGRVVKVMGDGVLVAFPHARANEAVALCRDLQAAATTHWQAFDPRCRARVVLGAGPVLSGRFGPPGQEVDDLFGHTLNQLFRASAGEFVLLPSIEALVTTNE
jgi:class 3 adenylate cyclase